MEASIGRAEPGSCVMVVALPPTGNMVLELHDTLGASTK
jgi:hypothetical protein